MKNFVKKITPEKALFLKRHAFNSLSLLKCSTYDLMRYLKHSGTSQQDNQRKLLGKIIAHYHVVEKGISFEEMRLGFGESVVINLAILLNKYIELEYDKKEVQFITACSVLKKYIDIHKFKNYDVSSIENKLSPLVFELADENVGGSLTIKKEDIYKAINIDFESFFNSRHSIREFSDLDVDINLVFNALEIAKKYPSVCNRQAARVYLIESKSKVEEHLSYQNGNRGFREKVNKLLVVTVDLSVFENSNERNQPYIDGGIYLMGLLLALHSQGLGAVALNWSVGKEEDKRYRALNHISDSEVIISFIGVGHLKEKMTIPKSERNALEDILTVVK